MVRLPVNMLTEAIEHGVPLVVLSPHLDDAVLSCGALLIHAAGRTRVSVVTLFTEAHPPPYTLSARQNLRLAGAGDADELYRQRRAEDRAALEPMGISCVHAGFTDALFRLRPHSAGRSRWARVLPELAHIYPIYRLNIISGRIADTDAVTLHRVRDVIQPLLEGREPKLLLAPLGVGGHVDHVLVRTAAELSGARVYYSDFPYNQQDQATPAFAQKKGLIETRWSQELEGKAELVRAYGTQAGALFPDGLIPRVPEIFFLPTTTSNLTGNGRSR
jgi:LmbE family N-acetylglucosaminyl deacetylase